jgi:hypothetical protein
MANYKAAIDEIAIAIADELRPLQAKRSRAEVEQSARKSLEGSRWLMSRYGRVAIRRNRPHINKLRKAIGRLLNEVSRAPRPIQTSMFSGISQPFAQLVFLNDLREMERRLAAANVSGGRDAIKQFSAEAACNFFVFYSDKAPTSGKPESPMRIVAGLIYEYLTGKPDQDLERSCEAALRKFGSHPVISTKWRKKSATLSQGG